MEIAYFVVIKCICILNLDFTGDFLLILRIVPTTVKTVTLLTTACDSCLKVNPSINIFIILI